MSGDEWWATFALGAVVGVVLMIAFSVGASAWRSGREDDKRLDLEEADKHD